MQKTRFVQSAHLTEDSQTKNTQIDHYTEKIQKNEKHKEYQ